MTLIEILIVVTILSLLVIGGLRSYYIHLAKARDATRKNDLNKIKVAFTEYLGDYGCFPTLDILSNCGGDELAPYLEKVPCDPLNQESYALDVDGEVTCPRQYRVLTTLEIDTDPVIESLHCDGEDGCGGDGFESYNYGVADGVPVGNVDYIGRDDGGGTGPTSTPTPAVAPGETTPTPTHTPTPTPTSTPVPGAPTPTPEPVYTHCCPAIGVNCNIYDPNAGGNCDGGTLYTSQEACDADLRCLKVN